MNTPVPLREGDTRGERPSDPTDETDEPARRWALVVAIGGSSLAFITGSVVNVALPALQRGLDARVADVQWVLNAYLLLLGSLILVGGSAGDRLGRRRVFVLGTGLFGLASIGCGLAPSVGWLIGARAIQGVGAAFLIPNSLALMSASFPRGVQRGRAIGTWAGFSALTTALGPVFGGALVDALSWRWVFLVSVPLALGTGVVAARKVPDQHDPKAGPALDLIGAAWATLSLGTLTYGLIASSSHGWRSPVVVTCLATAVLAFVAFIRQERRAPAPMMPLSLFRSPTFSGTNLMTLLLYFALNGVLFLFPFNLITVQGYSATQAGAALLPFTLVMGVFSRWSGGLIERWGPMRPLVFGSLIAAGGLASFAIPSRGGSYWATFFVPVLLLGVGMTIAIAPLTTVVMSAVDDEHAGTASGINNAAARLAGLFAVTVLGIVGLALFNHALDVQLANDHASPDVHEALVPFRSDLTGASLPEGLSERDRRRAHDHVASAFVTAFRGVALLAALSAVLGAVVAALTVRRDAHKEHKERVQNH